MPYRLGGTAIEEKQCGVENPMSRDALRIARQDLPERSTRLAKQGLDVV